MKVLILLGLLALVGCEDDKNAKNTPIENVSLSVSENADGDLVCEWSERVPKSRGRGHGVKFEDITHSEPAYLRGDVNGDGLVNRDDAMLAVKRLFKPENFECPATADVGGAPQTNEPDGFFTSQDIYLFNQLKKGNLEFETDLICESQCDIKNHMDPSF